MKAAPLKGTVLTRPSQSGAETGGVVVPKSTRLNGEVFGTHERLLSVDF